jgi:hypothetical protein
MTKSAMGLAWASMLLTGRELTAIVLRSDPLSMLQDASYLMGTLSEAMASRLGPAGQEVFQAGRKMQERVTEEMLRGDSTPRSGSGWGPVRRTPE